MNEHLWSSVIILDKLLHVHISFNYVIIMVMKWVIGIERECDLWGECDEIDDDDESRLLFMIWWIVFEYEWVW